MATWLNALLSGPVTVTVYRDGVVVDPATVGATLTTTGGVISLTTPGAENHTWGFYVTPTFLQGAANFRIKSFSFSAGLASAATQLELNGDAVDTQVLTLGPPVSPDPTTFDGFGDSVVLNVTEV